MTKYRPNKTGLQELLRGSVAKQLVVQHGEDIAGRAGDGFVLSTQQGKSRFRGIVYADTWSAKWREGRENVLVRVLG
ncbi:hypothetical protein [Corynebacterium sp. Marseille-P4611]|uniref:hypothetical protein n=1 Tax=Corynebacterium sp. Marseille-P4611 TaxID=2866575 RepID=UPI001CE3FBFE|nr:hypothetical protein [Corynebacterium sp. Marseille-P4611]